MLKIRLLAGMQHKVLARDLQLDPNVTVDITTSQRRAKEIIYNNQRKQINGEKASIAV